MRAKYILRRELQLILVCLCIATIYSIGCTKSDTQSGEKSLKNLQNNNPVLKFAQTITESELKEHVYYLASDQMEGRHSGTKGARAVAQYIADQFAEVNLKGFFTDETPYFQKFEMEKKELVECFLESAYGRVDNWQDFLEVYGDYSGEKEVELIFLGFGRESDFIGLNVKDKLVAMLSGDPESTLPDAVLDRQKIDFAMKRGCIGCLLIVLEEEKFLNYIKQIKPYFPAIRYYKFKEPQEALQAQRVINIGHVALAKLLGRSVKELNEEIDIIKKGEKVENSYKINVKMKTSYRAQGIVPTENVLGYIEGSERSDEFIILTAHYDGRGKNGSIVLNGANDNATGVAAMLELAEAFSSAVKNGHRPKRSIIFMMPVAEELGAVGSAYYVENPPMPLNSMLLNINMDPLGREDAEFPHLKNHIYIYCSHNGKKDLHALRKKAEKDFSANLTIKTKESYSGSDHVNFEARGIPVIAYTTGKSKDNHGPGDDPEKVQYKKLEKVTRLIFATVWDAAYNEIDIKGNLY